MNLLHSLSQTLGWSYVLLWSLSFYPQPLLSYRRGSAQGLSVVFALLNILGLSTYTAFNAFLLLSPIVRAQYAQRHPSSPEPPVRSGLCSAWGRHVSGHMESGCFSQCMALLG